MITAVSGKDLPLVYLGVNTVLRTKLGSEIEHEPFFVLAGVADEHLRVLWLHLTSLIKFSILTVQYDT
jgi:hypothetical protein